MEIGKIEEAKDDLHWLVKDYWDCISKDSHCDSEESD